MSKQTVVRGQGGPAGKWWLPVLLALIILAIVAGAYWATHPHLFGGSATSTPTATPKKVKVVVTNTPTPTVKPGPTGTPRPGPTGTPKAGPTATPRPAPTSPPRPGPTGTPKPGPTATTPATTAPSGAATATPNPGAATGGVKTGVIGHPIAVVNSYQQKANQGDPAFTPYLDPFQVLKVNLSQYGFANYTVVSPSPPPAPTPTPYNGDTGRPTIRIIVAYNGQRYGIFLDQPVQTGPKGIWIIAAIRPCAGTTYCQ